MSPPFMPHGHCYFWTPDILFTHVGSDLFIALAYYSIPLALLSFVRKRPDIENRGVVVMFALFILACGTTHVLSIVTTWYPIYRVEGLVKMITAMLSVGTAVMIWPLMPAALSLPSPGALQRSNEELARLNRQLEARVAERTRALEESNRDLELFATMASHDLQEPLRVVASYTQLIERRYGEGLDDKARQYLDFAYDAARRAQTLVRELLSYARFDAYAHRRLPVAIGDVLDEVRAQLGAQIRDADAELVVAEPLPVVLVDRGRLALVFRNLISNSLKYRGEAPCRIAVAAEVTHRTVTIRLRDNGIGFEAEHAERIFQPFRRLHTREEYEGNGIGLAVVRKIIEAHGGRIYARGVPGEGAEFTFTLPSEDDTSAPPPPRSIPPAV